MRPASKPNWKHCTMAHNRFGTLFCYTTWGESHGPAVGVVVDGCPAGLPLDDARINTALARRAPGKSPYTTPRKEEDRGRILSGVFEGVTTGAPISIVVENADADSTKYEAVKDLMRPGHANFTYLHKYGVFDYRGGGRASARETVGRVAAGAVADALLEHFGIRVAAYLEEAGGVAGPKAPNVDYILEHSANSGMFAIDRVAEEAMGRAILDAKDAGDSAGGVVAFLAEGVPPGLGEPVYGKLDAMLAFALMGLPAVKGVELGLGFAAAAMRGTAHNDAFTTENGSITPATNHAGGVLGGISTGAPLYGRVAFKPTASVEAPLPTVDVNGAEATFQLPAGSRHDPCVAVRAVPVVEAMCRVVLADALLLQRARAMHENGIFPLGSPWKP